MAKNLMARFMQVPEPNHPKANWAKDFKNITTADVGYGIPIFVDEILANSNVTLDLRCAMFTNPTVAPYYSRFKMQVTAWWCPTSCYVPSLRDGVRSDATTDYSFPTINFEYPRLAQSFPTLGAVPLTSADSSTLDKLAQLMYGDNMEYIPTSSIYHYLRMWPSNYSPAQFLGGTAFPEGRNAIPFLMYYDIFRNYILNNQENKSFIRTKAYYPVPAGYITRSRSVISSAEDRLITRADLDLFFKNIRMLGMNYPTDIPYDITGLVRTLFPPFPVKNVFFPTNSTADSIVHDSLFFPDYHYGLWRDTYMNDPFTAFISDENVDYERNTAKVVVSSEETATGTDLTFTMEQIRVSSMIQNFVRSHIFRNNAFDEYVDVEYGCRPQRNLDKPLFLGAISSNLVFNDIIASAQTGNSGNIMAKEQLGSRAAVGEGHMFTGKYRGKDKRGYYDRSFVKFHAPEPGYLMLILTIKPEVSYFEGYDPMYDKHSIFDLYRPSLRNIGYQDKMYRHLNIMPSLSYDKTGALINKPSISSQVLRVGSSIDWSSFDVAYAHEPYGFEYMGKTNVVTGQMAEPGTYLHWTGARSFNNVLGTNVQDLSNFEDYRDALLSTTILPEMFHYIFANTDNLDNFQFFYDFDYNVYQVVPHTILSWK